MTLTNFFPRAKNFIVKKWYYFIGLKEAKKKGISYYPPNYVYLNKITANSIVLDVGCADDADFSEHVILTHNCKSFGVDPTMKHFEALQKLEEKYSGKFYHLPYAVVNKTCKVTFHESVSNASGSILNDHANIKKDEVISYEVEGISIEDLKKKVGNKIDMLKLDLEGAEYELLENLRQSSLDNINQVFIEFHHHCIDHYSFKDTKKLVKKIQEFGFSSFTLDQHNFLFYRK